MGWFFNINQEMRELGLKGNDLLVFGVIHSISQGKLGYYRGGLPYLAEVTGATTRTVSDCLKRLTAAGHIAKTEIITNGVKFCVYYSVEKFSEGKKNFPIGEEKISSNNNSDIKDIDINIYDNNNKKERVERKTKSVFVAPTVAEVQAYCDERNNGIDAEHFVAYYAAKGWKIGSAPMKDWRAAVITWEKREAQQPRPSTPSPSSLPRRKESYVETAYRTYDKIFGTDLHRQKYGND